MEIDVPESAKYPEIVEGFRPTRDMMVYLNRVNVRKGPLGSVRQLSLWGLIDRVKVMEYRQQIKTFRLKYIFLAGKIVRTARRVVMKLSERYPYREIYEHSLSG